MRKWLIVSLAAGSLVLPACGAAEKPEPTTYTDPAYRAQEKRETQEQVTEWKRQAEKAETDYDPNEESSWAKVREVMRLRDKALRLNGKERFCAAFPDDPVC
jgi:hypothetical protein